MAAAEKQYIYYICWGLRFQTGRGKTLQVSLYSAINAAFFFFDAAFLSELSD